MQEGFDIISSLIAYNNASIQGSTVYATVFLQMQKALISSIKTERTDYKWIFQYLRSFIASMDSFTFSSRYKDESFGSVDFHSHKYKESLQNEIDKYKQDIKINDEKLHSDKNFCKIQMEYERIMNLLYVRLANILANPSELISDEEKARILDL